MTDKQLYEIVESQLSNFRKELKEQQDQFQVMVSNNINTGCFERNAINDLIYIQEIRAKISALEHQELLLRSSK